MTRGFEISAITPARPEVWICAVRTRQSKRTMLYMNNLDSFLPHHVAILALCKFDSAHLTHSTYCRLHAGDLPIQNLLERTCPFLTNTLPDRFILLKFLGPREGLSGREISAQKMSDLQLYGHYAQSEQELFR
jgi:hypothetical protein